MSDPTHDAVEGFERERAGDYLRRLFQHDAAETSRLIRDMDAPPPQAPIGCAREHSDVWLEEMRENLGSYFTLADVHNCITAANTARQDAIRAPAIREQSTALADALSDLAERIRALVDEREGA